MADIAKHTLVGIAVVGSDLANVIPDSVKLSPGLQKLVESGGAITPTVIMTMLAEPVLEFKTNKIDLLSAPALVGANDIVLYFRAYDASAGLGAAYISMTIGTGLVVPVSLSCQAGQKAELTVQVHATSSDGDAVPVAVGTTAAGTLAVLSDFWTLGTVTLGTAVTGVSSFTLNFGYNVTKNAGEGGFPYPTQAYIDAQKATLAITCRQLAAATSARLNTGAAETTITAAFRQLAEGGIPNGSYTVTAIEGMVSIDDVSGGAPSETSIMVDLACDVWAGTNYLAFATVEPS